MKSFFNVILVIGLVLSSAAIAQQNNPAGPGSNVLPSPGTVGDLVCVGPGTQGVTDCVNNTLGYATVPGGLDFTRNGISMKAAGFGPSSANLYSSGFVLGTCNNNNIPCGAFYLNATGFGVATTSGNPSGIGAMLMVDAGNVGSTAQVGNMVNIQSWMIVGTTTGNTITSGDYTGIGSYAAATASDNGTSGTKLGSLFGIASNATLASGATNWLALHGAEIDISTQTGASVSYVTGLEVVLVGANALAGGLENIGFSVAAQTGAAATMTCGYCIGDQQGFNPLASTATIMNWVPNGGSGAGPSIAAGINLSQFTFSGNAFASPGFSVDGSGNETTLTNLVTGAGSTTNPSLAFINCGTNCGIFAPGANQLEFAIGGVKKLDYNFTNSNSWNFLSDINLEGAKIVAAGSYCFNVSATCLFVNTANLFLFGSADVAAPVANTIGFPSVVAGTSNTAGVNSTIRASLSTGSGTNGDIIVQTGGTGAAATVQNTAVTAMTIKGGTQAIQFNASTYANCTALTTTANVMGCTASALQFKNPLGMIEPDTAADVLASLRPAFWTFKDPMRFDALEHVSLYADDVERMDPRCVTRDQDGQVHDYWDRCVLAYTIGGWQQHDRRIAELERQIDALRSYH
jgi:hypothetical protein